jgi:hypothetical protein
MIPIRHLPYKAPMRSSATSGTPILRLRPIALLRPKYIIQQPLKNRLIRRLLHRIHHLPRRFAHRLRQLGQAIDAQLDIMIIDHLAHGTGVGLEVQVDVGAAVGHGLLRGDDLCPHDAVVSVFVAVVVMAAGFLEAAGGGIEFGVAGQDALGFGGVHVREDGDADAAGRGVEGAVEEFGEVGEVDGAGVVEGFEFAGGVEVAGGRGFGGASGSQPFACLV